MRSFIPYPTQPTTPELKDIVGYTLPDLLNASYQDYPDEPLYFQAQGQSWICYNNQDLTRLVEHTAAGLLKLEAQRGDRIALLLKSDLTFLAIDLACAQAGLITVPLDLSQTIENILFSLQHSEAHILFVANPHLLHQLSPYLDDCAHLKWIVLSENALPLTTQPQKPRLLSRFRKKSPPPTLGLDLSEHPSHDEADVWGKSWQKLSWEALRQDGLKQLEAEPQSLDQRKATVHPSTLASIIYIPDESGELLGVTLSHENLTSTALASFAEMDGVQKGDRLSVVTFLPLTHIFARVMLYGHLFYSHQIYFSTPRRIMKHLKEIRPQILSTVPLLMHKVYRRLERYGLEDSKTTPSWYSRVRQTLSFKYWLRQYHQWAFASANKDSEHGWQSPQRLMAMPIFKTWRKFFGGRIQYCLTGGAALNPKVAQFFMNIGFPIYQGYGLTQTSSVVTFNRPQSNQPGSVGQTRLGAQIKIAQDGEILVQGTGIMESYWHKSEQTRQALKSSWLHTGDLGYVDALGRLILTGSKKNLFKLTTGKYVTPIPLEQNLELSPLVYRALVIGEEQKYCSALLFIDETNLQVKAIQMGLIHYPSKALIENPCIQALYQSIIDEANCHFPYWTTIKKIQLLSQVDYPAQWAADTIASRRHLLLQRFKPIIEQLYRENTQEKSPQKPAEDCQDIPLVSCPITAKSLKTSH